MRMDEWFGGKVRRVEIDCFTDDRGSLWPLDLAAIGFHPVRSFLVSAPSGTTRGGHGHARGRQLLLRVGGEITVDLEHAGERVSVALTARCPALIVSSPVWARQVYGGDGPALMVFCDTPYDPEAYIDTPEACERRAGGEKEKTA